MQGRDGYAPAFIQTTGERWNAMLVLNSRRVHPRNLFSTKKSHAREVRELRRPMTRASSRLRESPDVVRETRGRDVELLRCEDGGAVAKPTAIGGSCGCEG